MQPGLDDYFYTDAAFHEFRLTRQRRILRGVLATSLVINLSWIAYGMAQGHAVIAALSVAVLAVSLLLMKWLHDGRAERVAHVLVVLVLSACICFPLLVEGVRGPSQAVSHFWLIPLAIGLNLVFIVRGKRSFNFYFAVCLVGFLLIELGVPATDGNFRLPEQEHDLARATTLVASMIVSAGILAVSRLEFAQAEKALFLANQRLEGMVSSLLPAPIATRLKAGVETIADKHNQCSVIFAAIEGLQSSGEDHRAAEIVSRLDEIFSQFDDAAEDLNVEKIKTIGETYMAAAGVPLIRDDHAHALAELALKMAACIEKEPGIRLRIGINSGAVIAGVIGRTRFIYDLWGDAVNIASRMNSHGLAGEIQVTESTYQLLRYDYELETRGEIQVKGKGSMRTYLLKGRKPSGTD